MRVCFIILLGICGLIIIPFLYLSIAVNQFSYLIMVLVWILINLFYGLYINIIKKNNVFRLLSDEEWQKYKNKSIIHYSNVLNVKEGISNVVIPAHYSFKVNHLLPKEYREKGYVWFHLADNNDEPNLASYLYAHYGEGNPRKQKLIFKLKELPKEKIYIQLQTGYIVVQGDVNVTALVQNTFKWYNEKIYFSYIFKNILYDVVFIFYYAYIQTILKIKDSKKEKKIV